MTALEREFLQVSNEHAVNVLRAEQARSRKLKRYLRIAITAGIVALVGGVAAIVLLIMARNSQNELSARERRSLAGLLASQSVEVGRDNLELGWLLSIEADRVDQTPQTLGSMIGAAAAAEDVERLLYGEGGALLGLAYGSPDDRTLLSSAGSDGSVLTWDATTGELLADLRPKDRPADSDTVELRSPAFSPTEPLIAVGGVDGHVYLWDIQDLDRPTERQPLDLGYASVLAVAFSADGTLLAASGGAVPLNDDAEQLHAPIVVWNLETMERFELNGHDDSVLGLAFSPVEPMLASASADRTTVLWDLEARRPVWTSPLRDDFVSSVAFSHDGGLLAVGGWDKRVEVWNVHDTSGPSLATIFQDHEQLVRSVAFQHDGLTVASGDRAGRVALWHAVDGSTVEALSADHGSEVFAVAFDPEGDALASADVGSTVVVWKPGVRSLSTTLQTASIWQVAPGPQQEWLVTGGDPSTGVQWYEHEHGSWQSKGGAQVSGRILALAVDPVSGLTATGSDDGDIALWEPDTHRLSRLMTLNPGVSVRSLAFHPVTSALAAGFDDGTVALIPTPFSTDLDVRRMQAAGIVWDVEFGVTRSELLASSGPGSILRWNIETGETRSLADGTNSSEATSLDLNAAGDLLAVGRRNGSVAIIDLRSGRQVGRSVQPHREHVSAVAFNPREDVLASASIDGTVVLLDVESRIPLTSAFEHPAPVRDLAWVADGSALVTAGDDAVKLWDLTTDELQRKICDAAKRNLSDFEWDVFVGADRTYQVSCDTS